MNDRISIESGNRSSISQISNNNHGLNTTSARSNHAPIHTPVHTPSTPKIVISSNNGVGNPGVVHSTSINPTSAAGKSTHRQISNAGPVNTVSNTTHHAHPITSTQEAAIQSEDERMSRFLHLLSSTTTTSSSLLPRSPSNKNVNSNNSTQNSHHPNRTAPTVPLALTRRILQRQGVGYANETIPSIVSGAADRFIATVLQHSLICRDRRLKGQKLAKKEWKELRKSQKRIRAEEKAQRLKRKKIEEGLERLAKGPGDNSSSGGGKSKKSKASAKESAANGKKQTKDEAQLELKNVKVEKVLLSDTDSVDEEKKYYEQHHGESTSTFTDEQNKDNGGDVSYDEADSEEDDESEDDDEVLLLRDIIRPLEAWGMNITGKVGFGVSNPVFSESKASTGKKTAVEEERSELEDVGGSDQENIDGPDGDDGDEPKTFKATSPKGSNSKKSSSTSKKATQKQTKKTTATSNP